MISKFSWEIWGPRQLAFGSVSGYFPSCPTPWSLPPLYSSWLLHSQLGKSQRKGGLDSNFYQWGKQWNLCTRQQPQASVDLLLWADPTCLGLSSVSSQAASSATPAPCRSLLQWALASVALVWHKLISNLGKDQQNMHLE